MKKSIPSIAFKLIDISEQSTLPEAVQEWIYIMKKKRGVNCMDYGDKKYDLISLGARGNPGYKAELEKVEEKDRKIRVYIREKLPIPGGFYPQVITYPYLLGESEKPIEVWLTSNGKYSLFRS